MKVIVNPDVVSEPIAMVNPPVVLVDDGFWIPAMSNMKLPAPVTDLGNSPVIVMTFPRTDATPEVPGYLFEDDEGTVTDRDVVLIIL